MLQQRHEKLLCLYVCVCRGWMLVGPTMGRNQPFNQTSLKNRSQRWSRVMRAGRSKKKKGGNLQKQRQLRPHLLFYFSVQLSNHWVFVFSPESPAGCPASARRMPGLSFGAGVGREEVVGLFAVFVAQGILWVMLEDHYLSLLEPCDYPLQITAQEPRRGPRALS